MLGDYKEYPDQRLSSHGEFQVMRNDKFGQMSIANHRSERAGERTQSIRSASYRAGLKGGEFENSGIDKIRLHKVTKPAHTEKAALIVFAPKKDGSPHSCVYYRKSNAATEGDSYTIPRENEGINSLEKHLCSPPWTVKEVTVKLSPIRRTAILFCSYSILDYIYSFEFDLD